MAATSTVCSGTTTQHLCKTVAKICPRRKEKDVSSPCWSSCRWSCGWRWPCVGEVRVEDQQPTQNKPAEAASRASQLSTICCHCRPHTPDSRSVPLPAAADTRHAWAAAGRPWHSLQLRVNDVPHVAALPLLQRLADAGDDLVAVHTGAANAGDARQVMR